MNTIAVHLFGCLIEAVGAQQINIEEVNDLEGLRNKLLQRYPQLQKFSFVTAVDKKIIKGNVLLNAQTQVALMPPFSGG